METRPETCCLLVVEFETQLRWDYYNDNCDRLEDGSSVSKDRSFVFPAEASHGAIWVFVECAGWETEGKPPFWGVPERTWSP